MKRARGRMLLLTASTSACIALLVPVTLRHHARIDLTENRVYTISEVSRSLFAAIPEPVTVTYYVSTRLADRFVETREVSDLLGEYAAASAGKVSFVRADPAVLTAAGGPERLGIVPRQLYLTEEGEQTLALVYSGIVVSFLDRTRAIPFVWSTATLEYELTSAIRDLVRGRRTLAGLLLASPPGYPGGSIDEYGYIVASLSAAWDLLPFEPGEPLAPVDVVVIAHADWLDPPAVREVERFIESGGAVLFLVESVEILIDEGLTALEVGPSPVRDLLASLGVEVQNSLVLDEEHNPIVVEESAFGFSAQRAYPYPAWPVILERYTSDAHPVTARFTGLDLYWPTWLRVDERAEIIAATTPRAWLMGAPFVVEPREEALLRRDREATAGQYGVVAVSAVAGTSRFAVVSDADFLRDRLMDATGSYHNLQFATNLLQWLASDDDLLAIRSRPDRDLRLAALRPADRARVLGFSRVLNIVVVPLAVAVAAFLHRRRRRRRGSEPGS